MNNTVLTIDFDIIMRPSIEIYNNLIEGNGYNVKDYINENPLIQYGQSDLIHYVRLTKYLLYLKQINSNIQFIFIQDHSQILKYLINNTVINIDHHHDTGYNWETEAKAMSTLVGCGNWAYIGLKTKQINTYIWYHNSNSKPISNIVLNNCPNIIDGGDLINLDLKSLPIPSQVILCSSFEWILPQFRPLYDLWQYLLKS